MFYIQLSVTNLFNTFSEGTRCHPDRYKKFYRQFFIFISTNNFLSIIIIIIGSTALRGPWPSSEASAS
jgi:hypothetical protein